MTSNSPPAPQAQALSDLLAHLYQTARVADVDGLRAEVIKTLRPHLPFDGAAFGAATFLVDQPVIYDLYVWNMPADLGTVTNVHRYGFMRESARRHPGRAWRFEITDEAEFPEQAALARRMGMDYVMAVATVHEVSHLVNFLSIARRPNRPPFSQADAAWLELLMPHLEIMLDMSRLTSILRRRHRLQVGGAGWLIAATDIKGVLHVAEPGFDAILSGEWPNWRGPHLPREFVECLEARRPRYEGRRVVADLETVGTQVLVRLSPRSLLDSLSQRERAVAQLYAAGQSYKVVAQSLDMAPATVRHHLRSIYTKLGITDKAALAQCLHRGETSES